MENEIDKIDRLIEISEIKAEMQRIEEEQDYLEGISSCSRHFVRYFALQVKLARLEYNS